MGFAAVSLGPRPLATVSWCGSPQRRGVYGVLRPLVGFGMSSGGGSWDGGVESAAIGTIGRNTPCKGSPFEFRPSHRALVLPLPKSIQNGPHPSSEGRGACVTRHRFVCGCPRGGVSTWRPSTWVGLVGWRPSMCASPINERGW